MRSVQVKLAAELVAELKVELVALCCSEQFAKPLWSRNQFRALIPFEEKGVRNKGKRRQSYAATVVMPDDGDRNTIRGAEASSNQSPVSQVPINTSRRMDKVDDTLYLHVTENPNVILVSPPLSELNYASWNRSMRIALGVKNKLGFIDESIPNPGESDPKYPQWKRCNGIRYSQTDPHKIAELQNEIFKNTQGTMTVSEYFTKSNALWEQLKIMRPIPRCLNEEFETVKAGILVMDPLPTMEKTLNMTLKLERKIRSVSNQRNSEIAHSNAIQANTQLADDQSLVAASTSYNNKKKFNNGGKNVPKCTYCGMTGHTIEKCYKKHGYPTGSQASTNAAITVSTSRLRSSFKENMETHNEGRFLLTPHINAILDSHINWILDSGATDHIACFIEYFDDYHKVHGVSVQLPNGETVSVTHIGQVRLHADIMLHNVLCIPSFAFNIISVSKLTKQSDCEVVMAANTCTIQGHLGMMPHNFVCDACHFAKHKRSTFPVSLTRAAKCFDLVHMDVWGPFATASLKGEHYFLTIVDDHTRDCASEILCPHTTKNEIAERKHQHILNVARALRFQSGLPINLWGHCVLHASFLINRLPTTALDGKIPFEVMFGKPVDYNQLRTFGCLCFGATIKQGRNKLQPRAKKCVFIGFPANVKGYILYDMTDKSIFISRDVHFHEQTYPFKILNPEGPGIDTATRFNPPLPLVPITADVPASTPTHTLTEVVVGNENNGSISIGNNDNFEIEINCESESMAHDNTNNS
ncbi:PREDICTED: uncharacterized protein LOC109154018 [Ipomoea nil]|uniref:uncharacterized protein LOC109154018 n=1 Tax=Ipomoea nil TaxID=35883 RepID=UPI0009010E30|nr:PREDICTED: uncharacterized protein LOC109154018 [Ipomoea nil]